jgi:flavin-dependent dehydrogenase
MSTVAIIGSGMGGLVAGNLLAKKGQKGSQKPGKILCNVFQALSICRSGTKGLVM